MDLHFQSAAVIARLIRDRKISAAEALEHFLARIDSYNGRVNAVIWLAAARARERARAADEALAKGEVFGPLHGVPMTIKESYNVAGSPTTWGDPMLRDNVTTASALAVERLTKAGVVLFGKTNVPLMLSDHQSYNDIYGTTNNSWDLTRSPGGSSGGEAATLAAGLSALGAGSDIAGSLRNPAHYCGVYGHKPTWGADLDARSRAAGHHDADRHIGGRPDGAARRGPRSGVARAGRARPAAAGRLAGAIAGTARPPARRVSRRGVGIVAAVPDRH